MFYFTVEGIECRCNTAEELRAVVGFTGPRLAKPTRAKPTKAKPTRAKAKGTDAVKNLPYVEEGITWDVAKRVAKQLGREDIKQLRSDLKTRKDMGK